MQGADCDHCVEGGIAEWQLERRAKDGLSRVLAASLEREPRHRHGPWRDIEREVRCAACDDSSADGAVPGADLEYAIAAADEVEISVEVGVDRHVRIVVSPEFARRLITQVDPACELRG